MASIKLKKTKTTRTKKRRAKVQTVTRCANCGKFAKGKKKKWLYVRFYKTRSRRNKV